MRRRTGQPAPGRGEPAEWSIRVRRIAEQQWQAQFYVIEPGRGREPDLGYWQTVPRTLRTREEAVASAAWYADRLREERRQANVPWEDA